MCGRGGRPRPPAISIGEFAHQRNDLRRPAPAAANTPAVTTGGTPPEEEDADSSPSPIPHPPSLDAAIAKRERDFTRHQQERVRKEAAKKRKATIARKRREAAAQTAREAQAAEREAQRKAREEARQAAREAIDAYNRDYRRRKRAEALAKEQTTWTPAQWKAWRKREADKACPPGSPSWLVREAAKHLAKEQNLPADAVMGRLIELGGLDFMIKGAGSMGRNRCNRPSSVAAAVRALALYLDPDHAEMFGSAGH